MKDMFSLSDTTFMFYLIGCCIFLDCICFSAYLFTQVVDLPVEDPIIDGLKVKYRIGEVLKANCTSGESTPATNLTWFVNGRRTDEQKAYHQHRITRKGRHMERYT